MASQQRDRDAAGQRLAEQRLLRDGAWLGVLLAGPESDVPDKCSHVGEGGESPACLTELELEEGYLPLFLADDFPKCLYALLTHAYHQSRQLMLVCKTQGKELQVAVVAFLRSLAVFVLGLWVCLVVSSTITFATWVLLYRNRDRVANLPLRLHDSGASSVVIIDSEGCTGQTKVSGCVLARKVGVVLPQLNTKDAFELSFEVDVVFAGHPQNFFYELSFVKAKGPRKRVYGTVSPCGRRLVPRFIDAHQTLITQKHLVDVRPKTVLVVFHLRGVHEETFIQKVRVRVEPVRSSPFRQLVALRWVVLATLFSISLTTQSLAWAFTFCLWKFKALFGQFSPL